MAVSDQTLLPLIDRIYDAVERPSAWPETICTIGALIGGRRDFWELNGALGLFDNHPHGIAAGCYGTLTLSRADLRAIDEQVHEFGETIVRFLKIIFLSTLWSHDDVEPREVFGRRMTKRYLAAAGTPGSAESIRRRLIAALWEDGRMFNSDSLGAMRLLAPHLDRAVRLQLRLNVADLRAEMAAGALDHLTLGVILYNRSGDPIWHNRRAREMMDRSTGRRTLTGTLVGSRPNQTRAVRQLIENALSGSTKGVLAIEREFDVRPLLLMAMPLTGYQATRESESEIPRGVLFISDPDRQDAPTINGFQHAFNLTPKEALVAMAIAEGHGLKVAARRVGIGLTTARSHLQHTFEKTGTKQQAELVALVHRTLGTVRQN
jgi:DNA-binding CsgD family transcriptional regulator/PAS domain-containing protein